MVVQEYFPSFSLTLNNAPTRCIVNRVPKRQSLDCIKISSETEETYNIGGKIKLGKNYCVGSLL